MRRIAAVGPFDQGPLDVWQFAIVGFLVAAKGERLDSACMCPLSVAPPSHGESIVRPDCARIPRAEGMDKTGRSRFSSVQDVASARKMPLKVGKSGVIIRTVSRIIFGLVLPPVSVRVVAVSP